MKRSLILVLTFALSGCVYPIYKTLQPEAVLTVVDIEGNPIRDATVMLVSHAYPYGFEKTRMLIQTNHRGQVSFPKIKEWRTESLMIHGAEVFVWNWCVVKEGYKSYISSYGRSSEFEPELSIELTKGQSTPCPEPTKL